MARVTTVKKAQKAQGNCSVCGQPIPIGTSYKWAAPRAGKFARGHKIKAHVTCQFRASQLTTSEIKGAIYDAVESAQDEIAMWEGDDSADLQSILESAAESIREAAESAREKASNIEDGFGHSTMQSDELNERADAIEAFADDVEGASLEEFDEEQTRSDVEDDLGSFEEWAKDTYPDKKAEDVNREEYEEAVQEAMEAARAEWRNEQRDLATEALNGSPE